MFSYAALLGHQPALTKAELAARLPDIHFGHTFDGQYAIFETAQELDQEFLDSIGGTILIARKLDAQPKSLDDIPNVLSQELTKTKGKATFSLRLHGVSSSDGRQLFRACKNLLKQQGKPSRYIGNEHEAAKAIQLHDEDVLDPKHGCELMILRDKEHRWIGRTVAAQNVKAYTLRDIGKPVRDTTVGLLPPKLAQMMLNFGQYLLTQKGGKVPKQPTVLDPFCGTGVIPLEVLHRGWHALASDKELKAVNGCRKNIEWARKTYKILKKDSEDTVWKQDATEPFELKNLPDIIVTEGSLGPALRSRPMLKDAERITKSMERLEMNFLENCKKTLPGVPIVMMWPVWYTQKRPTFLTKVFEACHALGYRPVLPPHTSPNVDGRFSLVYRRPEQFVGREIVFLLPS